MTRHRDPLCVVEQLAVAEEIASLARHDLRNRLGAIRNASYFLSRRVGTTDLWQEPRVPKFFSLIETEIVAADAVIQSKLTVAELRAREPSLVPVGRLIDLAAGAVRVEGELEVPAVDDCFVKGDLEELAVAMRALIENGLESRDGARVRVEARHVGGSVRVTVSDDGPGLVDFEQSMRSMFTTKPGRIGLGLNIAARVVGRHGGSLSNESSPGGACLVVELPAVER